MSDSGDNAPSERALFGSNQTRDGLPPDCPRRYGADCHETTQHCPCRRFGMIQAGLVPPVVQGDRSAMPLSTDRAVAKGLIASIERDLAALRRLIERGA